MLTNDALQALLALEARATQGEYDRCLGSLVVVDGESIVQEIAQFCCGEGPAQDYLNVRFLAAARNNIRPLIEELLELRAKVGVTNA